MKRALMVTMLIGTFSTGIAAGVFVAPMIQSEPTDHGLASTPVSTAREASSCPATGCNVHYQIDSDLLADIPKWDHWNYPNAEVTSKNIGGGESIGVIEFGNEQSVAMSTKDTVKKVWQYYRTKLRLKDEGDKSGFYSFGFTNAPGVITLSVGDKLEQYTHVLPKRKNSQAKVFSLDSRRYHLVVMIFRANNDAATTIVVTYRPNQEFASLLKEFADK